MSQCKTVMTEHLFNGNPLGSLVDNITYANEPDWTMKPMSVVVEVDQKCAVASKLAGKVKLDESTKMEIAHKLAEAILKQMDGLCNLTIETATDVETLKTRHRVRVDISVGPARRI